MSGLDRQIVQIVSSIRRRIQTSIILKYAFVFACFALLAGILISIVSRFLPVYDVYFKAGCIVAASLLSGVAFGFFKAPKLRSAALKADSLGLFERTVTAVELVGDESAIATMQKKDTLQHLKKLDYKKKIRIMPDKKYIVICLLLALVLITTGFIPNPMNDKAAKLHELKESKAEQIKKVEKLIDEVKKDSKLTEAEKKEIETKLAEIKQEIKAADDKNELEKALQRSQKKMELEKEKYEESKENQDKMADTLSKFESTKNIAELIKKNDSNAVKEAIKNLNEMVKNMTDEQKRELSKALSELANQIKNNPELKDALNKASQRLAEGGSLSAEDLSSLSDSISELMQDGDISDVLSQITKELSDSSGNQNGNSSNGQGNSGQNSQNRQNGQGGQNGQNGQNGGQGGGAGDGTGQGSENQNPVSPSGGGLSSKESSEKKLGEYEKIFTPKTLGGDGETSQLKGQSNKGGSTEVTQGDNSLSYRGDSVPYNQVYGMYKDQAFESMNNSNIPDGMKEIVRDYFSSLDE